MANKDVPFGFRPFGPVLRQTPYMVMTGPVINLSPGDIVESDNIGYNSGKFGYIHVIKDDVVIASGDGATFKKLGAILSCMDYRGDPVQYIKATETGDGTIAGYVMVADDPNQIFVAQGDTAFAVNDIDLNYDITVVAINAPDSRTKLSTMEIAIAGAIVTATFPIRLLGQAYPGEDVHTAAGCRMICKINPDCHQFGTGTPV